MYAADNPFRTGRLDALVFRPQGTTWPALMDRLAALNHRAAFVGPEGSGKTAALDTLTRHLGDRGWQVTRLRIATGCRWLTVELRDSIPSQLGRRDAVLLDSAEQLNWLSWCWLLWLTRRAGALVIAVHKPGRLPTLHDCRTSAALLRELASELLGPGAAIDAGDIASLYGRYDGNIRLALLALYDQWAEKTL